MATKKVFLRIAKGQHEGLYQISDFKGEIELGVLPACPCCNGELAPVFDICQWGFFDDKYSTYAVCKPCLKAWVLVYSVATYELVSKRKQKQLGLSLPSKKGI